jgi:hypothetical protein
VSLIIGGGSSNWFKTGMKVQKPKKMKKKKNSKESTLGETDQHTIGSFGKIKINNLGIKKEGQKYQRTEKGKIIHPFPL